MRAKVIHMVGDRFSEFAQNDNVVTISRALEIVEHGHIEDGTVTMLLRGQGVPDERLEALRGRIAERGFGQVVQIVDESPRRAEPKLSHKHEPQNTMISAPWKVSEDSYRAALLIDDRCADMADHVTGQHLQGMVLIEASRQIFLAVTERFFLPRHAGSFYFVINKFDVSYYAFAFPTKLDLHYQIIDKKLDPRGTYSFDANIGFWQAGALVTEILVKFTAYGSEFLRKREAAKAREVAAATLVVPETDALERSA